LLDNFPFMVWLKDEKSRFLAVNNAFAKVFGWPSTESLIGKTDLDIAPRGLAQAYRADDLMVMRSGLQKNVVEQIETGGERRWFETYKSPVNLDEHRIGTVGFGRDITDRQNNQRALEDSEARYRSFIENLPLTVAITQDGLLKYINPTGVELIGYSAADCIGKSFLPLVFEADRPAVIAAHQQRMDGEPAPSNYMVRIVSNTGRVIDCQMHASNVQWDGRIAALAIFEDVTDYRAMEAELRRLATIDSLTELANRRQFFIRMDEALSRLQRDVDREVAILMCDLDHFKEINDRFGHAAGDVVLRHFSTLLRDELRKVDVAGRVGGEEFAVLLPESDQAAAMVFAERLRKKVAETSVCIEGEPVFITVSIGIAAMLVADETADQGLLRADKALYLAKAAGRNRIALAEVGELAQPDISSRSL
jgi:diguanylate cyclase (GGDEF)-like protein/PAS domain S-box-containing protein